MYHALKKNIICIYSVAVLTFQEVEKFYFHVLFL